MNSWLKVDRKITAENAIGLKRIGVSILTCAYCGALMFSDALRGTKPSYCTSACRQSAYRRRKYDRYIDGLRENS